MLKIYSVANSQESRFIFDKNDPRRTTWVVSDLKSKLDLQRRILEGREFIDGESVLRASELWKLLLGRLRPELQVVSYEFAISFIGRKLAGMEGEGANWILAPGVSQATYNYIRQLIPILSHPNGDEMMAEWFKANPASSERWRRWYDLANDVWSDFLNEGFVSATWIPGVLSNELNLGEAWHRPLIFDLGANFDQVEADLVVGLSLKSEVVVLRPEPSWALEFERSLLAYDVLEKRLGVEKIRWSSVGMNPTTCENISGGKSNGGQSYAQSPTPERKFKKFTTMIAEVKDSVAQVRIWLEQENLVSQAERSEPASQSAQRVNIANISNSSNIANIAIVAPDIEIYWPALESYLSQEGLPCQKDVVRRLHSYPDVARWLATLRLRLGEFDEADVELSLFDQPENQPAFLNYERFKVLYSNIYGREDLDRSKEVAEKFALSIANDQEISRDDFIAWSIKQLPLSADSERVEIVFKKMFADCPQGFQMLPQRWLAYLQQIAARIEIRVKSGDSNGLSCVSLSSAENLPAKKMIILGLTDLGLKSSSGTAVLYSDILSLSQQFGFHLSCDEQNNLEFEARWVIENYERELVLSVAETDFSGSPQAPSWLWMRNARKCGESETVSVPRPTRWDEIQASDFKSIALNRSWSDSYSRLLELSLQQDLGQTTQDLFAKNFTQTVSASGIEDYLECPFVFAAKRLFKLSDLADLDLEVDPSRRGSLMHKLFELLTIEPIRFDYSEKELEDIVNEARKVSKIELADERIWPSMQVRYIEMAKRFLSFEKINRARFPETKTVGREINISGFINPQSGQFKVSAEKEDVKLVGRIDRVDRDEEENYVIYDYKSSNSSVSQYGTWLKKNKIQLLIYSLAIENGLSELPAHPVVAGLYYVANPLDSDTGFKVEDVSQKLFESSDRRKRNRITQEQKSQILNEVQVRVREALQGIIAGKFPPQPRDQKKCSDCQWSSLCRAPHLNL